MKLFQFGCGMSAAPRNVDSASLARRSCVHGPRSYPTQRPADRLNGFSGGVVREKGQWKQHGFRQSWLGVSGRSADGDKYCVGEEDAKFDTSVN